MSNNVVVAVRVRPFSPRELELGACGGQAESCVEMDSSAVKTTMRKAGDANKNFSFDHSYWSHDGFRVGPDGIARAVEGGSMFAGQSKIYEEVARPLLEAALEGYNVTLFAYGQTGSGKSYTMVGYGGPDIGVIPLFNRDLFSRFGAGGSGQADLTGVTVSMLEIYNEQCFDLLDPKGRGEALQLRQHPRDGFYCPTLSQVLVQSEAEVEMEMDVGTRNRTVASTAMNATSSRAHTIFTLHLVSNKKGSTVELSSKVNMIDLAGSESAGKTQATGSRLKEGANINKSLVTLGTVIRELSSAKASRNPPFRDSKLTMLLQTSLGGNSRCAMLAALSPSADNYNETLSTLRYADQVKKIKNSAVKNENVTLELVNALRAEIEALKHAGPTADLNRAAFAAADESHKQIEELNMAIKSLSSNVAEKEKEKQQLEAARSDALDDMGISLEELGDIFHLDTGHLPQLVNLNYDPQLNSVFAYFLKASTILGSDSNGVTVFGSEKSGSEVEVMNLHSGGLPLSDETISTISSPLAARSGIVMGEKTWEWFNNSTPAAAKTLAHAASGVSPTPTPTLSKSDVVMTSVIPCTRVKIQDPCIHNQHCYMINDSRHKTLSVTPCSKDSLVFVNGERILGATELKHQDRLGLGLSLFFRVLVPPEADLNHHPAFAVASRESALAILLDEFESAGANSAGVAQDEMRAWATEFADKAAGVDGGSLAISQLQYACRLELTMRQTAANKGGHDSESAVPTLTAEDFAVAAKSIIRSVQCPSHTDAASAFSQRFQAQGSTTADGASLQTNPLVPSGSVSTSADLKILAGQFADELTSAVSIGDGSGSTLHYLNNLRMQLLLRSCSSPEEAVDSVTVVSATRAGRLWNEYFKDASDADSSDTARQFATLAERLPPSCSLWHLRTACKAVALQRAAVLSGGHGVPCPLSSVLTAACPAVPFDAQDLFIRHYPSHLSLSLPVADLVAHRGFTMHALSDVLRRYKATLPPHQMSVRPLQIIEEDVSGEDDIAHESPGRSPGRSPGSLLNLELEASVGELFKPWIKLPPPGTSNELATLPSICDVPPPSCGGKQRASILLSPHGRIVAASCRQGDSDDNMSVLSVASGVSVETRRQTMRSLISQGSSRGLASAVMPRAGRASIRGGGGNKVDRLMKRMSSATSTGQSATFVPTSLEAALDEVASKNSEVDYLLMMKQKGLHRDYFAAQSSKANKLVMQRAAEKLAEQRERDQQVKIDDLQAKLLELENATAASQPASPTDSGNDNHSRRASMQMQLAAEEDVLAEMQFLMAELKEAERQHEEQDELLDALGTELAQADEKIDTLEAKVKELTASGSTNGAPPAPPAAAAAEVAAAAAAAAAAVSINSELREKKLQEKETAQLLALKDGQIEELRLLSEESSEKLQLLEKSAAREKTAHEAALAAAVAEARAEGAVAAAAASTAMQELPKSGSTSGAAPPAVAAPAVAAPAEAQPVVPAEAHSAVAPAVASASAHSAATPLEATDLELENATLRDENAALMSRLRRAEERLVTLKPPPDANALEERVRGLFMEFDADCSGFIDREELLNLLTAAFGDADGDGDVEEDEAAAIAEHAQQFVDQNLGKGGEREIDFDQFVTVFNTAVKHFNSQ